MTKDERGSRLGDGVEVGPRLTMWGGDIERRSAHVTRVDPWSATNSSLRTDELGRATRS